jgi:hypothetical protein
MRRLSDKEITTIGKLAKTGHSLNAISDKLNLHKSAVYYWFRKSSPRKMSKVTINRKLDEDIGEIIGAFCGDGNYYVGKKYEHKIRIFLSHDECWYAEHLSGCLKRVFDKQGSIWIDNKRGLCLLRIFGIDIINFLKEFVTWDGNKTYSIRLKECDGISRKFMLGFLRGLYFTDGWFNKKRKTSNFGCTSPKLTNDFSKCLHRLEVYHHLYSYDKEGRATLFYLVMPPKSTEKFLKMVKIKSAP